MNDSGGTQVTQVGEGFIPGAESNAAIARLLGFEAEVKDDKLAYFFDVDPDVGRAPAWRPCPDYCGNDVLCAELMERCGRVCYVRPVPRIGKQRLERHVCIFDHEGGIGVTAAFTKDSHALAAALYFVLGNDKSQVTCI